MKLPPTAALRTVPLSEWPTLIAVGGVAVAVEIGLRTMSLPRLASLLGVPLDTDPGIPYKGDSAPILPEKAHRQVRATARVLRHWPWGDTCLRTALIVGQRLRARKPVLRIGVARMDDEVRAHAWLEISGVRLDPIGSASSYELLQPAVIPQAT